MGRSRIRSYSGLIPYRNGIEREKNVGHITYEGKRKLYLFVYLANKYGRVNLGRGREEARKVFRGE